MCVKHVLLFLGVKAVMKGLKSVLIVSTMALCVLRTLAAPGVSIEPLPTTVVVPKTVISSRMRVVFTVGLEGTGHHYIGQVKDYLFRSNEDLVQTSRPDGVNRKFYYLEHATGESAQHYGANLNGARENMRKLAQRGSELQYPGTVVFIDGKNSYPEGPGPNKVLKYMDLRMLAELAEEEGVDLRVLYLRRPVTDTLIANTIHRQFQK